MDSLGLIQHSNWVDRQDTVYKVSPKTLLEYEDLSPAPSDNELDNEALVVHRQTRPALP